MKEYPQANVFIDGNCDERGTVEYNLALGEHRAHVAMSCLVGLGVPAARLSTTSYGKEKPVCTEPIESCWVRNRRAHFTLKPALGDHSGVRAVWPPSCHSLNPP